MPETLPGPETEPTVGISTEELPPESTTPAAPGCGVPTGEVPTDVGAPDTVLPAPGDGAPPEVQVAADPPVCDPPADGTTAEPAPAVDPVPSSPEPSTAAPPVDQPAEPAVVQAEPLQAPAPVAPASVVVAPVDPADIGCAATGPEGQARGAAAVDRVGGGTPQGMAGGRTAVPAPAVVAVATEPMIPAPPPPPPAPAPAPVPPPSGPAGPSVGGSCSAGIGSGGPGHDTGSLHAVLELVRATASSNAGWNSAPAGSGAAVGSGNDPGAQPD
ncbi:hypothetical protein [Blastococcus tunisiensis]|uniref:hypothetical protein n=1 Tax=Blastococcus tunisiensis TaxID=1798228 RepID=UPI00158792D0|nr:hypothetical protein [Blastococcus sp. DSM 46838]